MKILVDIGHHKNAHIMGQLAPILQARGHTIHYVYRERERLGELCSALNLQGTSRGRGADSRLGKLVYLLKADVQLLRLAQRLKPDLLLSFASPYLAHVAQLRRIPLVVFDDTENNPLIQRIYLRSATRVAVPSCFRKELGSKQRRFSGYFELAYLHPDRFSPNPDMRNQLGLAGDEKFVLLRTVAWKAVHDLKYNGLSKKELRWLVNDLSMTARIVISAEGELPADLEPFSLRLSPEKIHHVIAAASLVFSEGATMAAEAAVLGVPTVHCSDLKPGYLSDLENRFGLLKSFRHIEILSARNAAMEMLSASEDFKIDLQLSRRKMLAESIDIIEMMARNIEEAGSRATVC